MDITEKKIVKYSNVRQLAISMMAYGSASIFGPLVFIGGLGYFLDQKLGTKPIILIISIFIAFITTNILLFKKIKVLMEIMNKEVENDKNNENNNNLK